MRQLKAWLTWPAISSGELYFFGNFALAIVHSSGKNTARTTGRKYRIIRQSTLCYINRSLSSTRSVFVLLLCCLSQPEWQPESHQSDADSRFLVKAIIRLVVAFLLS